MGHRQVEVLCNCFPRVANQRRTHRAFVPYRVAHRVFPVEVMVSIDTALGVVAGLWVEPKSIAQQLPVAARGS